LSGALTLPYEKSVIGKIRNPRYTKITSPWTYQQLYDLAGTWNKEGNRVTQDSPKEILIYEVNDKTATAKLTAEWGIDLFHLSKVDGVWKIMNIIWQSNPKKSRKFKWVQMSY